MHPTTKCKSRGDELEKEGTSTGLQLLMIVPREALLVRTSRLLVSPVLKFRVFGPCLEVVLISGLRRNFSLHEVTINILDDEGAEVDTVNLSTIGDKVFHTISMLRLILHPTSTRFNRI
ncbi:UNVERIFIED_CONTAM: hypothetical protein Slati_0199300 [Sesamum latifolium]|uniref:Uncharacterized protein n=1 Tax=Sesamum latifolium TaxID=2727402 RepID=A0AAW2YCC1_9LAMI